ncbi:MAG: O-antigen ligase family protein [Bacteroidales bacterium]|nr:O-antigen ligase family protein [Bacteroidales bacterium]
MGNIVASVICIVHAIYQSVDYNEGSLFFNSINEDENNYFRYSLLSVFHHPAYFSMYIVFSIAVLFYLKSNDVLFNTNKKKVLFYLIVGFFLVMVYFLSSRAGIFTAFILIVWKILLYVKKHKRLLIKLFSVVIIIAGIIVLSQNSRIIRTYYDVKNTFIKGKEYESYPARLVLWESAVKVTEENFWLGTGTGDAQEKLSEIIKKGNFKNDEISFLNAHNQFLETFMSSGLIGFLILLMIVLYSFYYAVKAKNELFILFLILIVINLIFESMLNTIAGIVFLCYFLNYFIFVHSVPVKK